MYQYDVVFIGIPLDLKARLLEFKGKNILVVEDKTMYQHHQGFDIHHPLTSMLYHISKDLSPQDTSEFDDRAEFYEQIIMNYHQQAMVDKAQFKAELIERKVELYSGVVKFLEPHKLHLSWLNRDEIITYEQAFFSEQAYFDLSYENPFVYGFGDINHFHQLPQRVAIEMDSLEALELAHLWARFGSQVHVLITQNALQQIDSLYFRDAIRTILDGLGIVFYPRTQDIHLIDQQEHLKVSFTSMNQPKDLTVDAYFVKGNSLEINDYYTLNESIETLKKPTSERLTLNLVPPYVEVKEDTDMGDVRIQKDASELTYFRDLFAFDGGIELTYSKANHRFISGIFFCTHAPSIADSFELLKLQNLSLVDLAYAQYSSSIFSIFKEFALDILDEL